MENKYKVLIVDDVEMNRSLLADMLCSQYEILEAANGLEAVAVLDKHHAEVSIVLLDIMMPEMDGFEVLTIMNKTGWITDIPVIMISAETSSLSIDRAYSLGATDYINRPFDENTVRRRVKNTIMLYAKQKMLEDMVAEQSLEKERNSYLMVEILSNIVEFRNGESGQHVLNIRTLTEQLLRQLNRISTDYHLSAEEVALIVNASSLHDIGKISIPEEILNKPGLLTSDEFNIIKTHSEIGAQILEKSPHLQNEKLVRVAKEICRWHHERFDGNGYPDGLKGDAIPISAQVVALADVYDALTHIRVYKPAYSHETAMQMIRDGECGAFNPVLLQCLVEVGPHIKQAADLSFTNGFTPRSDTGRHADDLSLGRQASSRSLALLEQERVKYQFFASMSKEIQFEYNRNMDILTLSEWGAKQLGLKAVIAHPEQDKELLRIFAAESYSNLKERVYAATPLEPVINQNYLLLIQGELRWYKAVARPLWVGEESPEITGIIGKFIDIHDEYLELTSFKQLARQDPLTQLRNHRTARKEIEDTLRGNADTKYAMLLFDLDNFKLANDHYGHLFGDQVLRHVSELILKSIRSCDVAARIGGDEFLVFLSYQQDMEPIVKRIFHSLTENYEGFSVSVSLGIALCPENGTDYEGLFRCADQALYMAKKQGRKQYCFYDHSLPEALSVLSPMDNELNGFSPDQAQYAEGEREV